MLSFKLFAKLLFVTPANPLVNLRPEKSTLSVWLELLELFTYNSLFVHYGMAIWPLGTWNKTVRSFLTYSPPPQGVYGK